MNIASFNPALHLSSAVSGWKELPESRRRQATLAVELLVVMGAWLLDHSLAVGLGVLFAVFWLRKMPPFPWRLGGQIALVAAFLIASIFSDSVRSVGPALAIGFAIWWIPLTKRLAEDESVPEPARRAFFRPLSKFGLAAAILAVAVTFPYYASKMFTIPVFGVWPDVHTGVTMLVFIMMALGLNIVVGYAGLLDLGYVAFYAMGAYTVAWFASLQFAGQKADGSPVRVIHFGAVGIDPKLGGIHISIWILLAAAGIFTSIIGILIGLPTLRLRGDYLAIVTLGFGEIMPQVARNGDNFFGTGFNLTNGPNGITPIDAPGFGNQLHDWTGGFLPTDYLSSPEQRPPLLLDGARPRPAHRLLQLATARLAARPRLGRDPRGRDRRGRDGRAADADEDLGLRDRRVLRRRRRAPTTPPSRARRSPRTSSSTSRSSSSAWSSSAGWGTSGASSSAPRSSPTSTRRASRTRAPGSTTTFSPATRPRPRPARC